MCCTGESSCGGMPCRPATASRPPPPFAEFISGFRLPHLPLSFFLSQVSSDGVNWAPVCPSCIQRRGRTLQRRSCCFVQNISRFPGSCIRFDEMEPSADYRNYHSLPSIIGQWLKVTCHNEGTAGCSMKERGASGSLWEPWAFQIRPSAAAGSFRARHPGRGREPGRARGAGTEAT